MNKILLCLLLISGKQLLYAQADEWTWMKGPSIANDPGTWGTQGVASLTNNPPGLYEACQWTDSQGNFWRR